MVFTSRQEIGCEVGAKNWPKLVG